MGDNAFYNNQIKEGAAKYKGSCSEMDMSYRGFFSQYYGGEYHHIRLYSIEDSAYCS